MSSEQPVVTQWQKRLLPLMASMLVALSVFFCVAISLEAYRIQKHIEDDHDIDLGPLLASGWKSGARS